jgi:MFS transporter, DHA2 family, multidrug resistance protein
MGSLPLAKASVGSAMNDTARLVGGAFGVAVLGSTISLVYRTHIAAAAALLPARATGSASGSLQAALQIAQHLGAPRGSALETAARLAFTDAMNRAALVAVTVALAAAMVALILLPARAARPDPAPPGHADADPGLLDTRVPVRAEPSVTASHPSGAST